MKIGAPNTVKVWPYKSIQSSALEVLDAKIIKHKVC